MKKFLLVIAVAGMLAFATQPAQAGVHVGIGIGVGGGGYYAPGPYYGYPYYNYYGPYPGYGGYYGPGYYPWYHGYWGWRVLPRLSWLLRPRRRLLRPRLASLNRPFAGPLCHGNGSVVSAVRVDFPGIDGAPDAGCARVKFADGFAALVDDEARVQFGQAVGDDAVMALGAFDGEGAGLDLAPGLVLF